MLVQTVCVFHLVRAIHDECAVGTGPEHIHVSSHTLRYELPNIWNPATTAFGDVGTVGMCKLGKRVND